jgi:RND family efflux transporter MFP subunit
MNISERIPRGLVGTILAVALAALSYGYADELARIAAHVPVVDRIVARWAPGLAEDAADHGHDNLIAYWTCSMHPSVRATEEGQCPICGMALIPVERDGGDTSAGAAPRPGAAASTFRVEPHWQQAVGVTTTVVESRHLSETIRAVGRVTHDESRLADVNLKLSGWIENLRVAETGQFVRAGDTLFDLYSPELVSTQGEYLTALDNLERVADSPEEEVVARARSLVDAARRRLRLWDLGEEEVDRLAETREVRDTLPVTSPATGYVLEKMAVDGMRVDPAMRLYRIANLDRVWVIADLYESEARFVRQGQRATMRLPYDTGQTWTGRVDYIYPTLEPRTRTLQLRVVFSNPDLRLRPDMYADVYLEHHVGPVLAIPREAVVDLGMRQVVFIDLGGGLLQAREIDSGVELEGYVEVRAGLVEGERVVSSGNFLLDAESKVRGIVPLPLDPDESAALGNEARPPSPTTHRHAGGRR